MVGSFRDGFVEEEILSPRIVLSDFEPGELGFALGGPRDATNE